MRTQRLGSHARRVGDGELRLRLVLPDAEREVVLAGGDERGLPGVLRLRRIDALLLVARQVPGDPVQPCLGGSLWARPRGGPPPGWGPLCPPRPRALAPS